MSIRPNTTQVPNLLFDAVFPDLGHAELRVMLWIVRQTYGWQREWSGAGYTTVTATCDGTGLSRPSVVSAFAGLVARGLAESQAAGKTRVWRLVVEDAPNGKATLPVEVMSGKATLPKNGKATLPMADPLYISSSKETENCGPSGAAPSWADVGERLAAIYGGLPWHVAKTGKPKAWVGQCYGLLGSHSNDDPLTAVNLLEEFGATGRAKFAPKPDSLPAVLGMWLAERGQQAVTYV